MKNHEMQRKYAALPVLTLCGALLLQTTAFAIPPFDNLPEGLTQTRYDELHDDTITWEELPDLVQYCNPTYTQSYGMAMEGVTDTTAAYGAFSVAMSENLELIDNSIDGLIQVQNQLNQNGAAVLPSITNPETGKPFTTTQAATAYLQTQLAQAKAQRSQISRGFTTTNQQLARAPQSVERALFPVKKQLTSALQTMVLGYAQMEANRSMVEKQLAVYEAAYAAKQNLGAQGMATEAEITQAKNNVDTAKKSLQDISDKETQLLHQLGLQTGYGLERLPAVDRIPDPDLTFVETTDAAADKEKAMQANADVRSAGKAADGSQYAFQLRDLTENEARGKLSAKMDELYANMKQQKALYDAAKTTLERASLTKASAERQYQLGMLGRAEYEAQQLAYTSYEASAEIARLNLVQAINTYQWAVNGVVTL